MIQATKPKVHSVIFAILCLFFITQQSSAHPMPSSRVEADFVDNHWQLTLMLPNDRLVAALKQEPSNAFLAKYVLANISVKSRDENQLTWAKSIRNITPPDAQGYWQVDVVLTPPKAPVNSAIDIDYQVITETIITHKVTFWLMHDKAQETNTPPQFIAKIRGVNTKLTIAAE